MKIKEKVDVVISGIGAKFPECNNIDEFREKLFSKSDLLTQDLVRWNRALLEKPYMTGKIPDSERFDYTFFGVPSKLVHNSDPQMAQMLERSYEAIVDAGVNPVLMKGHNVCVVAASSLSDAEVLRTTEGVLLEGSGMIGHSRTMMANRISYCFNFTGPSYSLNSSWVSAIQGLEIAANCVAQGMCESAIVTACNLIYHNSIETEYTALNLLAPDGKCMPFDANANGFARSEATVTFFLQRAQDAKRHYCTVLKTQAHYLGNKTTQYIHLTPNLQEFFKDFYSGCNVNPSEVSYIEAFGSCDKDYDSQELNTLSSVYCNGKSPMLVGSAAGNVGNAECVAGFISLAKCIIAMECGLIPPTTNHNTPNPQVPSLVSGQLKVVTEPTPLTGDLVAVNCLTYTGNVGHLLVKRHNKTKLPLRLGELPSDGLPRLVLLQTRTEEGAKAVFDKLSKMPVDTEFISLINDVFKTTVPNYLWRTHITLPVAETRPSQAKVENYLAEKWPVWFIFSGMGSQWLGMGTDLMQIPMFAASIDRCDRVLAPRGLDIKHIITTTNPETFDNVLNCFVGIAAIQIGLVDILRAVGVSPDGMIGHSVGELGCAYADGCVTADEMILAAYCRGKASLESDNIRGLMAAVGLGYNDIKDDLPPTIDVACHNSTTSSTLSGPTNDLEQFVEKLKNRKIFAKTVSAGGIAYHSRYIKEIGHKLLTYLHQVIQNPKPRSARWVSSSVPEAQWNSREAQYCSAEYLTNNLLNSVLFEEACRYIPENAILIEIAPHGLLQAILHRSVTSLINLSLTNRTAESNTVYLLEVLGKLHNQGIDLDVNALYPAVQYPVSRGTPSLVDLATWDHTEKLYHEIRQVSQMLLKGSSEMAFQINEHNPSYGLWKDHSINDTVVVPEAQILMYSWKMVFHAKLLDVETNCVCFEDITIYENASIKGADDTMLGTFSPGKFNFEVSTVSRNDSTTNVIMKGRIDDKQDITFSLAKLLELEEIDEEMTELDIYPLLAYYGCQLGPQFQCLKKITFGKRVCVAEVQWADNIITFLDALFKIIVFIHSDKQETLMQPSSFTKLTINPKALKKITPNSMVKVLYDRKSNRLVCEAAELCGVTLSPIFGSKTPSVCWREVKIQAHENIKFSLEEFLSACVQLASQAALGPWAKKASSLNIIVMKDKNGTSVLFMNILNNFVNTLSDVYVKIQELELKNLPEFLLQCRSEACLIVGQYNMMANLIDTVLDSNIYWLTFSSNMEAPRFNMWTRCVMSYQSKGGQLSLLKKKCIDVPLSEERVFEVQGPNCVQRLRERMSKNSSNDHVVVVSSNMTPRHLLPILASEPYAHRLCTIFILDQKAPKFSVNSPLYKNTVSLGLPVNILSNGTWGTLISTRLDVSPQKKNIDRLLQSSNKGLEVLCTGLNLSYFTLNQELDLDEMELNCVDYAGYMGKERVMGVAQCDSVFSLTPDPILKWTVPSYWTVEEAATVPVIYTLAYYCVLVKGYLQAGEDVLVNGGLSPLGQAVVGIALHIGANVFATVTEEKEVTTLLDLYPSLNRKNVLALGSQDIQVFIRNATAGKGVEVVVNCLQGNDMISSVKAMGLDCRFLHLGQISIRDRYSIGMEVFLKRTSFFGICLENIITSSHKTKVNIQEALKNGIKEGVVKPLKMTIFSFKEEVNALMHLKSRFTNEKTILINDKESKLCPRKFEDFSCAALERAIILGTKSELWLDVAEWLVLRGSRELVVFAEENEDLMNNQTFRFSRLINKFKTTFRLLPSTQLHSQESALSIIEEILKFGDIAYIFCIQQDEGCSAMRNLDLASRKLVPHLRQFVSLLGQGAAVSESRAESELPVCSIQSILPLQNPAHVLPYLVTLPADFSSNSRFFVVSDNLKNIEGRDCLDIQSFLPSTLDELYQLGASVRELPVFSEQVTLSPGYLQVRHTLLPVFVVPGFEPDSLQPLLRQLLHPAFSCSLPTDVTSISEYAQILLQGVLKIQSQSTFNLIGSSWGGPVALTLAHLLEARGHQVWLFLLEGAPSFTHDRVRALCSKYSSDLGTSLLADTFKLPSEVLKGVAQCEVWEDKLRMALLEAKVAVPVRDFIAKALTSLYSQLNALVYQETPNPLLHGDLTLITCKPLSKEEKENFKLCCGENANIVTIGEDSYTNFICNAKTAAVINENIAFDWKLK